MRGCLPYTITTALTNSDLDRSLLDEVPQEVMKEVEQSVPIRLHEREKLLRWYPNLTLGNCFIDAWTKSKAQLC